MVLLQAIPVAAKEQLLNRELMDFLDGDPIVNLGSDGILTQLPQDKPEVIASGKSVYETTCASCHGDKLQGQPNWNKTTADSLLPAPPHNVTGHTWHHADDQLFEMVKYGPAVAMRDPAYRSAMPAFQAVLSDQKIQAVLVYIRSTWPAAERQWQSSANDRQTGK